MGMKDKRNRYGAIARLANRYGAIVMAQRLRNNIFVNLQPLPLLCEISGALHLRNRVLRQAGRRNTGEFQNFHKVDCRSKFSTCRFI